MLLFIVKLCLIIIFICISISDIEENKIPNQLVAAVFVIALFFMGLEPQITLGERVKGMLCVSLPMAALLFCVPGSFGGGDIKLMWAAGFALGFKMTIIATIVAIFLCGIYCCFLVFVKKKSLKEQFALGPFLCMGLTISLFFGEVLFQLLFQ
ncbi:MAG: A24 family peptidase [Candidatus Ruminococcus intestinipullorum]|nr:A24 family peptidase [Candidatus Ruminococcus intestinipullorum]